MKKYTLEISEDEAIVLFEFFFRYDNTGKLKVQNAAEYAALTSLQGQIDKTTAAMFDPEYATLLEEAQARLARGVAPGWPGEEVVE